MKTKFFSICLMMALLISSFSYAKIRRVGYLGPKIAGTDYTDLQPAHDAAATKDTIMLYPGSYTVTVTKNLVFIGYGYYISGAGSNANLQALQGALSVSVYLSPGSDSSRFEGIDGLYIFPNQGFSISNINIRRCYINNLYSNGELYNKWSITQSVLYNFSVYYGAGSWTDLYISNCLIKYFNFGNGYHTGLLLNNTFYTGGGSGIDLGTGFFFVKNNIFLDVSVVYNPGISVFQYNVFTSYTPNVSGSNNQYGVDATTVFVGYPAGSYSNDGAWALQTTSPAKNAGEGGIDCGAYGGPNPYRLSGMPAIPSFYKLTAPSNTTSTNPYTITFSVRSNN